MRVSLFHNAYRQRGGEDTVVELQEASLRAAGHHVAKQQVSNADLTRWGAARAAWGAAWNPRAYRAAVEHLLRERAEVGHVHNWFPQLSPSVYSAHKDLGIPVVQTLHNYRLACAKGTFVREGAACHDCRGGDRSAALRRRCYRGSLLQTSVWERSVRRAWEEGAVLDVDAYVAPSETVRRQHVLMGLSASRIHVIPHACYDPYPRDAPPRARAEGGALFVGRCSEEKGLDVLLEAWRGSTRTLTVVGDGPTRPRTAPSGVRLRGSLEASEARRAIAEAGVLVLPHRWEEPFGMVVIEAFAAGRPVISSAQGGPAELIRDGADGLLVPPGDPLALRRACDALLNSPERLAAMGARARARYEQEFRPQVHQARLVRLYRSLTKLPVAVAS